MTINELHEYLTERSDEICAMNKRLQRGYNFKCTEDEHECEFYAYVDYLGQLLDVCYPDYFRGTNKPYSAVPLPCGSKEDLEEDIIDQCWEQIDGWDEPERTELMTEFEHHWGIIA